MNKDELYMHRAIELALKAKGMTSPNPLVGALIVKDGRIIGEGYHSSAGQPHAEIEAINNAVEDISNSELYITLEPCNFHGKTPPCVETIERIPFKRIIIATRDPNPKVNGKSVEHLMRKGYEVTEHILESDAQSINEYYNYYMINNKPYIILKIAQSADGFIAPDRMGKFYLTGEESRSEVHYLRQRIDAILTGSGTINSDNPMLDTRLSQKNIKPLLIIADFSNKLDYSSNIMNDDEREKIIFVSRDFQKQINTVKNTEYIFIENKEALWEIINNDLQQRHLTSILIEGGSSLMSSAIENQIPNELILFIAPFILGNGKRAITSNRGMKLELLEEIKIENDVMMRYRCLQD